MKRSPSSWFWQSKRRLFLILLVCFFVWVIWPVKFVFNPSLLKGTQLLVFTNEAENRPCGGFVTAFGTASVFPPKFELKNAYHLENSDFGPTTYPLSRVSGKRKFWDLGDTPDLALCAKSFQYAYEQATDEVINHVILVDLRTVELIFNLFAPLEIGGQTVLAGDFFYVLSRGVADIDRHDEEALATRKTPLASLGKTLITKTVFSPWKWGALTRTVRDSMGRGGVYIEAFSPEIEVVESDFAVIEWNLGGAKSSRSLRPLIDIKAQEYLPHKWQIDLDFHVDHLGGYDEPVSQDWKGIYEFRFPEVLGQKKAFREFNLAPGESFDVDFQFYFNGDLGAENLSFFQPRGSHMVVNWQVSLFPQQSFEKASFPFEGSIGEYRDQPDTFRKHFNWSASSDVIAPFLTFHEIGLPENLTDSQRSVFIEDPDQDYFYSEMHFNEKVVPKDEFSIVAFDRDVADKSITDHPIATNALWLADKKTLLVQFSREAFQKDERFYVQVFGVEDLWGNVTKPQKRTLITR